MIKSGIGYLVQNGPLTPMDRWEEDAGGKKLSDTANLIDVMLARNVGTGTSYYRYDYDGYGEQVDGANFSS